MDILVTRFQVEAAGALDAIDTAMRAKFGARCTGVSYDANNATLYVHLTDAATEQEQIDTTAAAREALVWAEDIDPLEEVGSIWQSGK